MKSLKDISWLVPESTYRADPALSYSTLARYEREGFNNLSKLFDRIESPSLTFGQCVDTLITGSEEEFNQNFLVAELTNPISDTQIIITKKLFEVWKNDYSSITDIPDDKVLITISDIPWNNHWKPETRVKNIKKDCNAYYKLLYIAEGRTIISSYMYQDVLNTVDKLKSAYSTRFYFEADNAFDDNIQRFYQLKFKTNLNGINYRCMADELITFHDKKLVVPIDLKTSSKPEWDFYKSFIDWRYDIQSCLYWLIIRKVMDEDSYFKDFKLANYRFIVINKSTLTPLVWEFKNTQRSTTAPLKTPYKELRHPLVIGAELWHYLNDKPKVPDKIELIKPNIIDNWILSNEDTEEK